MKKKSMGVSVPNEWAQDKPKFGKKAAMSSPQPGYKSSPPSMSSMQPGKPQKKAAFGKAAKRKGNIAAFLAKARKKG